MNSDKTLTYNSTINYQEECVSSFNMPSDSVESSSVSSLLQSETNSLLSYDGVGSVQAVDGDSSCRSNIQLPDDIDNEFVELNDLNDINQPDLNQNPQNVHSSTIHEFCNGLSSVTDESYQILQFIFNSATIPSSTDEIWYGIDGKFIKKLQRLADQTTLHHTQDLYTEPMMDVLPPIMNSKYVEGQYIKQTVTIKTPFKADYIHDLTFVDSTTWDFLSSKLQFDIALPRKVITKRILHEDTQRVTYVVEKQPLRLWIVPCSNKHIHDLSGLKGRPIPMYFSCQDTINDVKQAASTLLSSNKKLRLFQSDLFCNEAVGPKSDKDVGIWKEILYHPTILTLEDLQLTGAMLIHIVDDSVTIPTLAPTQQTVSKNSSFFSNENVSIEQQAVHDFSQRIGGVVGIQNLGNTCFMNSALQCLSHALPLTNYFLSGQYLQELNVTNPLGMKGRLASAYAHFLHESWDGSQTVVMPRALKFVIGQFAPQFIGYQQQDSQELTAFLLDGLHEDLNRIIHKPYIESIEGDYLKDNDILAEETWNRHKQRNDSFIVDKFQGLYRSRLQCPICQKISVVFDPFMYLSLPLPNIVETPILVTLVISYSSGSSEDSPATSLSSSYALQFGCILTHTTIKDIKKAILLQLSEILKNYTNGTHIKTYDIPDFIYKIITNLVQDPHIIDPTNHQLTLLRCRPSELQRPNNCVKLLLNPDENINFHSIGYNRGGIEHFFAFYITDSSLIQSFSNVTHTLSSSIPRRNPLLMPDIAQSRQHTNDTDLLETPVLLSPLQLSDDFLNSMIKSCLIMIVFRSSLNSVNPTYYFPILKCIQKTSTCKHLYELMQLHQVHETISDDTMSLQLTYWDPTLGHIKVPNASDITIVEFIRTQHQEHSLKNFIIYAHLLTSPNDIIQLHSTDLYHKLYYAPQAPSPILLEQCLEDFMKEELLGEDNMWYCNACKEHRQARKKIDIWRVPEILVIHLKRFNHTSHHYRSKNTLKVLFDANQPLHLKQFIRCGQGPLPNTDVSSELESNNVSYNLFGVSNHSGGLASGHYTATVKCYTENEDKQIQSTWMMFNDSSVYPCMTNQLCTPDAYLLFYEQIKCETK